MSSLSKASKIIPTTKDIIKNWDGFSSDYISHIELNLLPFYFNLTSLIKANRATKNDKILELSVGGGLGFYNLANNTKAQLYGGDISSEMIKEAKRKIAMLPNTSLNHIDLNVIDNEDLSRFNDNYFSSIISNFSLHIVSNPLLMLKETKRTLDSNNSNASAAFTVWGQPKNNFLLTLLPDLFKKHNFPLPNRRSLFHLSKKDVIYDLCKEAGFSNITLEYTSIIYNYSTVDEFEFYLYNPPFNSLFEDLGKDNAEIIKQDYRKEIANEIKDGKKSIMEGLIIHLH